ncbi:MAG: hypothetical protein PXZ08_06175 [Actinomycetota bacterium]|nr:hypothetical protein [Actinomycetota bacterium]
MTSGVTTWLHARRTSVNLRALILILLAIVIANSAFIFFGYESSPIWWTSSIAARVCLWTCGIPSVDPNVGFITQPLGHLAALDLLHGHLPWWNYFEGMGQPLAGEMQSTALLPLILLFIFPAGLLLFHLSLEFIAGASTYYLVRRLGVGPTIATLAGVLFALNGTFSWIGNAAINPVAFLPTLILGIEIVLEHSRASRRAGWVLMATAVALSVYAGFPEMAYLDGLIAAGWAITRLFSLERSRRVPALGRFALGGGIGIALALPILVAFFDFTKYADVGAHAARGLSEATTPLHSLPLLVNPYLGGTLFAGPSATPSNLLGYVTATVAVFAIVGVVGTRLRPLRWFLTGWIVTVLAGVLNFLELRHLWNLLPEMNAVAFARYIWPSVEFAVIILAALGLSDIVEHAARRTIARWATLGVTLASAIGVFSVMPLGGHVTGSFAVAVSALIILPFITLAGLGYSLQFVTGRAFVVVAVTLMALETMTAFTVPTFRSPTSINIADNSLSYLQQNEGLNRFISLGVLNPNWGSQYGINELNAVDLPLPQNFSTYIHNNLAPSLQVPRTFVLPFTPTTENEVAAHIADYEALGVQYLLVQPKPLTPALSAVVGTTPIVKDFESALYVLPHPKNFYTTALGTCVVIDETVDAVSVNCPSATSVTRLELSMPGWSARVNGVPTPITSVDNLTQTVAVPAGLSRITFSYLPPHEDAAMLVAALALVAMASTWRPRRGTRRRGSTDDVDGGPPVEEALGADAGESNDVLASS